CNLRSMAEIALRKVGVKAMTHGVRSGASLAREARENATPGFQRSIKANLASDGSENSRYSPLRASPMPCSMRTSASGSIERSGSGSGVVAIGRPEYTWVLPSAARLPDGTQEVRPLLLDLGLVRRAPR